MKKLLLLFSMVVLILFFIAGSDRNFQPADVNLEKNRLVVSNKQISNPVAVRFSFSNRYVEFI